MAVARKPEDTFVFRTTFIMSDETVMLVTVQYGSLRTCGSL